MENLDSYPKSLTPSEEKEYFLQSQQGDTEAKSKLIEGNLRLVVDVIRKTKVSDIQSEDLISIGTIGLIKAVNTFDVLGNLKFSTYATRCINNEILMYIKHIEAKHDQSRDIFSVGILKITPDKLQNSSIKFQMMADEAKLILNNFLLEVEALNSSWEGEASQSFTENARYSCKDIEKFIVSCEEYSELLRKIAVSYEETEASLADGILKLTD